MAFPGSGLIRPSKTMKQLFPKCQALNILPPLISFLEKKGSDKKNLETVTLKALKLPKSKKGIFGTILKTFILKGIPKHLGLNLCHDIHC